MFSIKTQGRNPTLFYSPVFERKGTAAAKSTHRQSFALGKAQERASSRATQLARREDPLRLFPLPTTAVSASL